jgi:HAD superfamily hydrolase (TIGR01509 family)
VGAAAILDVDGTLVDSNYQHAIAWYRALREHDVTVPVWRLHRLIGVGGDQLVARAVGDEIEERLGDAIRESESRLYGELIDEVVPFEGARELIADLRDRGHAPVLASSAKEHETEHYVELLDAGDLIEGYTTSADVERTKPEPDLVATAMRKAGERSAVMVGDSTWDVEAAGRAGLKTVAVLTGGFSEAELREAGAVCVFESLVALRESLDATPFAG